MQVIRVLVKGSRGEAARAAASRGIPSAFVRERRIGGSPYTRRATILAVEAQHQDAVARWFGEAGQVESGKGYPPGTVLFYNVVERRSSRRSRFGS